MDAEQMEALREEIRLELSRSPVLKRLLKVLVEARTSSHLRGLSVPLLNERETDMLRGKIEELHNLAKLIHNGDQGEP